MDHFCIALFFLRNELNTYHLPTYLPTYVPTLPNINNSNTNTNNTTNNNNNNGSFLYSAILHKKRTHYQLPRLPTFPT